MTRHALDAAHYTEPQTLALEREGCSAGSGSSSASVRWCASATSSSPRKIAGVPVVVQRTESGIRAFLNQCPHRLSAIQTECTGQRPLVCPYHAWSFGAEGSYGAFRTPSLYQFSAEERARIGCASCTGRGGATAVRQPGGRPVAAARQFDDGFLETLREVSSHLDTRLIYSCHKVRYNWKLNMENVKDYNHVPFVHPKTFLPVMTAPVRGLARARLRCRPRCCACCRRRNAGAAFAELPHQGADPALQELVLRPLRGLRRRARLLQLVHLPERELLQRPWRALPAPAVRSVGTRRDRLPPVDDDCPAQGSEDRFQRFAEHPDSRRA
ncbi:Rieske 2Fe-2S domain-containing protein [Pseudomonas aeruginosa]|nr:Rieske 2Fe-2S domain-containing protein [Pseudomonas aeruginosa]